MQAALQDMACRTNMAVALALCCAAVGCVAPQRSAHDLVPDAHVQIEVTGSDAPQEEIIGIGFEPLRSRTAAGDAVPHMELTGLAFLPGDQGLLLWDKSGRISHHALTPDGLVLLGDVKLEGVYDYDDCGLISVALDPDWQNNGYLYAAACSSATHSSVRRYEFHAGAYEQVNASAQHVISFGDDHATKPWHNVGSIGFFPDAEHSMWILVGEKALPERAQDLTTQLGSVLRIIPSREPLSAGYVSHPDNPYGGAGSDPALTSSPEIYAWGFRSPWRGATDARGRLWVGDVGDAYEEVNLVRGAGDNFGWSAAQGGCQALDCQGMRDPVVHWSRDADHHYRVEDPDATPAVLRVAWVGVPYERGAYDPYRGFLADSVLVSDMCVGFVRAVAADGDGHVLRDQHVGHLAGLSGAAQGPDGYLYVTSYGGCTSDSEGVGGRVLRVLPRTHTPPQPQAALEHSGLSLAEQPLGPMPQQLSEAGFFADMASRQPIARAVRYTPSLPLWTNGADKERWLLLPPGTQVDNHVGAPWEFPVGAVFGKTFAYATDHGSEPVETRIMRRTEQGWEYHAYKWVGQDAELLSLERSILTPVVGFGEQLWHAVPSRFDCRTCHESNAMPVIGFDELRLNAPQPEAAEWQLQALYAQGVLRYPPPDVPDSIAAPDALSYAVLGYLHGNCAHCHNDSAHSMSALSLQHTEALTQLIGMPTQGSGQITGIRVQPGAPELSVLYQAMVTDGSVPELKPMPPLGVQRKDYEAAALIEQWIRQL
jgi:glucose/arabinose dehydrogenase